MPNTREKLIDLLKECFDNGCYSFDEIADHLIANGVRLKEKQATSDEASNWIPVDERLPEEDIRVLVWVGENNQYFPNIDTDRLHEAMWVRWNEHITHWMPLPEPPKGE